MSLPHDWCRTLEQDGTTILLMRGWNETYERPQMTTTFQLDHFVAGDTILGETTLTAMKPNDDTPFTDSDWEQYCAPEAVAERVDQLVSAVLGSQNALH